MAADTLKPAERSELMSRIRSQDTRPERLVRSLLHRLGCRFRLHRADLPGHPDIVLPKYQTVIFVHGCFWHRHAKCRYAYTPKSRMAFWQTKFDANRRRDRVQKRALRGLGWCVHVIWECETKRPEILARRLELLVKPQPSRTVRTRQAGA